MRVSFPSLFNHQLAVIFITRVLERPLPCAKVDVNNITMLSLFVDPIARQVCQQPFPRNEEQVFFFGEFDPKVFGIGKDLFLIWLVIFVVVLRVIVELLLLLLLLEIDLAQGLLSVLIFLSLVSSHSEQLLHRRQFKFITIYI